MGGKLFPNLDNLLVQRVRGATVDLHDDRLVLHITDHNADAFLAIATNFNNSFTHYFTSALAARAVCSV